MHSDLDPMSGETIAACCAVDVADMVEACSRMDGPAGPVEFVVDRRQQCS